MTSAHHNRRGVRVHVGVHLGNEMGVGDRMGMGRVEDTQNVVLFAHVTVHLLHGVVVNDLMHLTHNRLRSLHHDGVPVPSVPVHSTVTPSTVRISGTGAYLSFFVNSGGESATDGGRLFVRFNNPDGGSARWLSC